MRTGLLGLMLPRIFFRKGVCSCDGEMSNGDSAVAETAAAALAARDGETPEVVAALVVALRGPAGARHGQPAVCPRLLAATGLAAIVRDSSRYLAIDPFRVEEAVQIAGWTA